MKKQLKPLPKLKPKTLSSRNTNKGSPIGALCAEPAVPSSLRAAVEGQAMRIWGKSKGGHQCPCGGQVTENESSPGQGPGKELLNPSLTAQDGVCAITHCAGPSASPAVCQG